MAKKLLNESTIRRFMKLADMGAAGSQFLEETYADEEQEINEAETAEVESLEENVEEGAYMMKRDEEMEEAAHADEEAGDLAMDDMDMGLEADDDLDADELEVEDEPENDNEALIRNILADLQKLAGEVGVDLQLDDADAEPADDLAMEMAHGDEIEEAALEEETLEEEALEEEAESLEESKKQELTDKIISLLESHDIEVVDDEKIKEDLVKEVTLRVAKRILKEKF